MADTRERPILFSGPMVRAILDGRKTQTRRVVTPQPIESYAQDYVGGEPTGERRSYGWSWEKRNDVLVDVASPAMLSACPYGRPGDRRTKRGSTLPWFTTTRLWVRETWAWGLQEPAVGIGAGVTNHRTGVVYRADGAMPASFTGARWRPSIHMPRWACRIVLEVTGVRVERLQEISEADAIAEGVLNTGGHAALEPRHFRPARDLFAELWDAINAKRAGCSWAANPWVWVIEFRRVEEAARG